MDTKHFKRTEIPRKADAVRVISATRVRRAMQEEDWETVSKLVLVSTLQYLKPLNNLNGNY